VAGNKYKNIFAYEHDKIEEKILFLNLNSLAFIQEKAIDHD
jgi:hypothetical protein